MHLRLHPHPAKMSLKYFLLTCLIITQASCQKLNKTIEEVPEDVEETPESKVMDTIKRTYTECASKGDMFKCFKIRALKMAQRAMKSKEIEVITGIDVKQVKNLTRQSRTLDRTERMNEDQLQVLENESINGLLLDVASK